MAKWRLAKFNDLNLAQIPSSLFFCSVGFKFYPLGEQQNSKNSIKEKEARRNPFPSSVIVVSTSRERRSRSSAIRISRKRGKRERRGERRREGLLARRQRARPAPVGGRAIRFRRKKKGPRHYITAVLSSLELNALTTTPCNWQREKGSGISREPHPPPRSMEYFTGTGNPVSSVDFNVCPPRRDLS